MTCVTCGCQRYVSEELPREPRFETHQVATIGDVKVEICYGGCLHNGKPPNYHPYLSARTEAEEGR